VESQALTVVHLTADNYEAVRAVWEAAGLPVKPGGRDSREQFVRQMAGDLQAVIGVMQGDELVGVVLATHDGRKGWINRLAVRPEHRRKGIARRLIAEAERTLRAQGMQIIAALIEDGNTASLALFEQAGYSDFRDIHYLTKRESDAI
jgi:ribosomal protein S18 acetylase RimI-like enzyme